jgi:hypothetical protein
MHLQAMRPPNLHRIPVISYGDPTAKFGCRKHAGFSEVAITSTDALRPGDETADLGICIEFGDAEPVNISRSYGKLPSGATAYFLKDNSSCPAIVTDEEIPENVQSLCAGEVNKFHRV